MSALVALLTLCLALWPTSADGVHAFTVALCESHGDPAAAIVDSNRQVSKGVGMVQAYYWGLVPDDLEGQVQQIRDIWGLTGDWREWSCG